MSGFLQHDPRRLLQCFHIPFSGRAADHSRLTETAAADTASLDFQSYSVLCRLNKRNHRSFQPVVVLFHIQNKLFFYHGRYSRTVRRKRGDGSVLFICDIIEGRNVNSRNFCRFQKEILSGAALLFIFFICVKQSVVGGFSFSYVKQIEKRRQRLRIISAGSSADHQRIFFTSLLCFQRDPGEIQKLKYIGIAHFITQCDPQEVKIFYRILGFQGKKRDLIFPHHLIQIRPR